MSVIEGTLKKRKKKSGEKDGTYQSDHTQVGNEYDTNGVKMEERNEEAKDTERQYEEEDRKNRIGETT